MSLLLKVTRGPSTEKSTPGILSIASSPFCNTLELPVRDGLPGSAIPPGTYRVEEYSSPHFARQMPLIVGIPGRSGIEIHYGNFADETRGCILVGFMTLPNAVLHSRLAFDELWEMLVEAWRVNQEVTIQIV